MRAVRIYEYGGPEKLTFDEDVPDPIMGDDSVLIEAAATSVNHIDWKVRSGARQKDFPLKFPAILGQDVSGVVRAIGGNVRTFKPGDRVLAGETILGTYLATTCPEKIIPAQADSEKP